MPVKGQKITDSETLERLAKMREKALETRRAKAKQKQDVKMAEQLKESQKVLEAQETIKKATTKAVPEPERQKQQSKIVADEAESISEPEIEHVVVKKPKAPKKKVKKQVVIVESDSSESEEEEPEVIVRKSTRRKQSRVESESPPSKKDAELHPSYDKAYSSLFLSL